jgi:ABC-type sugar transport systems, permease components
MKKDEAKSIAFLLPAIMLALVFVYFPLLKTLIASFFSVSFSGKLKAFTGLANYKALFSRTEFLTSVFVTVRFTLLFVPFNTALVLLAAVLSERERKNSPFFETAFFLPMALSLSSACLVFKFFFNPSIGLINSALGLNIEWLESITAATASLLILCVYLDFGIDYILLITAFKSLDESVTDAAVLDGAGETALLFRIKLPLIKPTLNYVVFMGMRDALLMAVPPMILTEGGPFRATETIVYHYYNLVFRSNSYGQGAAISAIIFLFCALTSITFAFIRRKRGAR